LTKTKKAEEERTRAQSTLGYDKVFAMYDDKIAGSNKYEHRTIEKSKRRYTNSRLENVSVITSS